MSSQGTKLLPALLAAFAVGALAAPAAAQATIKRPGDHPSYGFEAEPHLVLRDRSGPRGDAIGPGFRGTVVVVDNGFVPSINNSVGIGFGLDWLVFGDEHCPGGRNGECHRHDQIVLPVVMQWNFWLHRKWSVFGEPGLAIILRDHDDDADGFDLDIDPFVLFVGGRFHFGDTTALTLRLGYPAGLSLGFSFLM